MEWGWSNWNWITVHWKVCFKCDRSASQATLFSVIQCGHIKQSVCTITDLWKKIHILVTSLIEFSTCCQARKWQQVTSSSTPQPHRSHLAGLNYSGCACLAGAGGGGGAGSRRQTWESFFQSGPSLLHKIGNIVCLSFVHSARTWIRLIGFRYCTLCRTCIGNSTENINHCDRSQIKISNGNLTDIVLVGKLSAITGETATFTSMWFEKYCFKP